MDARSRSRGLARINRLTGWLAGGALVASGAFVALLAHPHAGAGATATPPTTLANSGVAAPEVTVPSAAGAAPTTGDPATSLDPLAGANSSDGATAASPRLNPPVHVPRPSSQPSQVSSGAS